MTTWVPILMYHEVAGPADTDSPLAVPPAAFADQIAALAEGGFTSVTVAALTAAWAGQGVLPERPVVITFDDGFADFYETALPVLAEHAFTATMFVTTGWIAGAVPPARPRPGRMLTWQQLAESAAAGVEIGAHSHSHPQLDQLSPARLAGELTVSRRLLEDRLEAPVPGMAYPFGYSDSEVRNAVRAAGYRYACAVANATADPDADPFAIPRLTIGRGTRLETFARVVRGQQVPLIYARNRSLTKGYAVVRRTRAALNRRGHHHSGDWRRAGHETG